MKNIPFEFATHDDCLNKMVPSDLRCLISERDSSIARVHELEAVQGEPVGQFTVAGGRTLNDRVFFETGLPDGDYKLYAQALAIPEKKT